MSFLSSLNTGVPDSGGGQVTTITTDGEDYRVHAFESVGTNTFTVDFSTEVDILLVGGGGSGGDSTGGPDPGGGGAGGLVFKPNHSIDGGSYDVVVGDGGTAPSDNGDDSTIDNLTALGGGSSNSNNQGFDGGSGGGVFESSNAGQGIQPNQSGDSGTYGFGNDGGEGDGDVGGGGGGAGQDGSDGYDDEPLGGDGMYEVTPSDGPYDETYNFNDIFGDKGEVINGESWFAGGGAGGSENVSGSAGIGGRGGGASYDGSPVAGQPNTGGGGTGADNKDGADGGSGIVLIRLGPL